MGLPISHEYDAILVIVDRLTKYTAYVPITTTITAAEMAFRFEQNWISKRGFPTNLIMDRDTKFTSAYCATSWKHWASPLGLLRPTISMPTDKLSAKLQRSLIICAKQLSIHSVPNRLVSLPARCRICHQQYHPRCYLGYSIPSKIGKPSNNAVLFIART